MNSFTHTPLPPPAECSLSFPSFSIQPDPASPDLDPQALVFSVGHFFPLSLNTQL